MKGIEVYLVLVENDKDVCYLEYKDIDNFENTHNGIMMTWKGDKYGISLKGKIEDKKLLTAKLLKDHKKTLRKKRKEIDEKFNLLKKINIECL